MNRVKNPALWIGFVVFAIPILLASKSVPADWHDPMLLGEALLSAFGTWFLSPGWNKPATQDPPKDDGTPPTATAPVTP